MRAGQEGTWSVLSAGLQCHTLSRWTVDRDRSSNCVSAEPVPAPLVAAKVRQVLVSFRLDSPEGAGPLGRAEVF